MLEYVIKRNTESRSYQIGTFAVQNDNSHFGEKQQIKSFFTKTLPTELDSKLLMASKERFLVCKVIRREDIVVRVNLC